MIRLRALIFDVDGTLAETEEAHREAFNNAFADAGLDWHWDRETYRRLLRTTGGRERMEHHARTEGLAVPDCAALHRRKTEHYKRIVGDSGISLRPGVETLILAAREQGIKLAIATTTSRTNVDSLLAATLGADALSWFGAVCCAEDVAVKKPDPEVYLLALRQLGEPACDCLAFEDSVNGLDAAKAANLACIVTPGLYTAGDRFEGATLVIDGLNAPGVSLGALSSMLATVMPR